MSGSGFEICIFIILASVFGIRGQISNTVNFHSQFSKERNCSWIKNVNDFEKLALHERSILESCLYGFLQDRSSGSGTTGARMSPSPLEILPPVSLGQRVPVEIQKFTLRRVIVDESMAKAVIMASLSLSWSDPRMQWDVGEWKIPDLEFKASSSLWTPDVSPSRSPNFHSSGYANTRRVKARSDGNVTSRVEINAQTHCVADYDRFPNDNQTCCFKLFSHATRSSILYHFSGEKSYSDPDFLLSPSWKLDDAQVTIDNGENRDECLKICIGLSRRSPTLRIELTVPVAVSALVLLIAPMTGDLRGQLLVKLFVLLLQLLSFQFLVQRTPNAGLGRAFPKLYFFYDYTIGTTIVNIFVSLLIFAFSQRSRTSPPPPRTLNVAERINRALFCCDQESNRDDSEKEPNWIKVFVAVNGLMNLVFSISYLVGTIVIFVY